MKRTLLFARVVAVVIAIGVVSPVDWPARVGHAGAAVAPQGDWTLFPGDRVVLLGDTLFERDGQTGFLEAGLVAAFPEADLTVRNLGWGGDTVWAESRGVFDQPAQGYERMLALVRELRPTVIFIAYGRNESYAGEKGVTAFGAQLAKLCDDLRETAGREAVTQAVRLVLVTPHPFETNPTCRDAGERNAVLAEYVTAIRDVAAAKSAGIVDLFAGFPRSVTATEPLTENGIHLTSAGGTLAATILAASAGRSLPDGFSAASAPLRELITAKNQLFFHRWRPANETYLFLFRKHEQGNNAAEIPQFDPLVAAAEAKVRAARKALLQGAH